MQLYGCALQVPRARDRDPSGQLVQGARLGPREAVSLAGRGAPRPRLLSRRGVDPLLRPDPWPDPLGFTDAGLDRGRRLCFSLRGALSPAGEKVMTYK